MLRRNYSTKDRTLLIFNMTQLTISTIHFQPSIFSIASEINRTPLSASLLLEHAPGFPPLLRLSTAGSLVPSSFTAPLHSQPPVGCRSNLQRTRLLSNCFPWSSWAIIFALTAVLFPVPANSQSIKTSSLLSGCLRLLFFVFFSLLLFI